MTRRFAVTLGLVSPLLAYARQGSRQRLSPHETVSLELGNKKVTISYGRPYLKGRHMGDSMAPFDTVWRLGADEATKITLSSSALLGDKIHLDAGSYSLFTIPSAGKWTIIVNKTADQWGAFNYDESKDVGRFDLTVKPLATPVEEFTISLKKASGDTANLTFEWDKASVSTSLKLS